MTKQLEDRFPYVVYYYAKDNMLLQRLTKRCFKNEQDLKSFLSNTDGYISIDAVYKCSSEVKFEVKTIVDIKE